MLEIQYTNGARKDLKKLDRQIAVRILGQIEKNATSSEPLSRAKPLTGELAGTYRYRIGDYRAIFRIDADRRLSVLLVLRIKHRKDIYK